MKLIARPLYMKKLYRLRATPDIKIITGMRRSGKSELMRAYINDVRQIDSTINVIAIDFADLAFDELKDYQKLYKYVEAHYKDEVDNLLFIDEVQLCPKFELAINSFHNSQKYDIYITGSNAFLLSSDLATLFTGRYIEVSVYPFSFAEYCRYFEITDNYAQALVDYLQVGGLAGSYVYQSASDAINYRKQIYHTLIKRDLVDKYHIQEIALLDSLSEFMLDNIANLTSASKVSNLLNTNKLISNHVTVGNYLKYLCNAFMFYKVQRYDISGKRYLQSNEKYYVVDTSLRYALLGARNMDYGRAYENLVALQLLRQGYSVYVGKLYQKEIDFVAMKNSTKLYIQVADDISSASTLERELMPLQSIKDAYPKMLLANIQKPSYDKEGIKIVDLADWLLRDEE